MLQTRCSVVEGRGKELCCKGGPPSNTSAAGRTGLTCGNSEDRFKAGNDGSYVECGSDGRDTIPLIIIVILGGVGPGFVYYVISHQGRAEQTQLPPTGMVAINQTLPVVLQLSVRGMLYVDYPEPISAISAQGSSLPLTSKY
jgi:hypothetical protein